MLEPHTWNDWQHAYACASAEILREALDAGLAFGPFNSAHEGYAVILEELDELWDDIKANNDGPDLREAIQVGAMALRYIADMSTKRYEHRGDWT